MIGNPRLFSFIGSRQGRWRVNAQTTLKGTPLPNVERIDVRRGSVEHDHGSVPVENAWILQGVTSNERYVTSAEKSRLLPIQPNLGRSEATCAVMIPMSKSEQWWSLAQDERRNIFARSGHNELGMKALPAIARRLHHCRDLSTAERFDFVTWFEFAPEHQYTFDRLMESLRSTEEWEYVDQEVEIRMTST